LVLAFDENTDVQLRITTVGRTDGPDLVIVATGRVAVASYACRVDAPRPRMPSVVGVGALTVVLAQGLTMTVGSAAGTSPRTTAVSAS
jgi:hypothetical protein